jgi:hypothetical protein
MASSAPPRQLARLSRSGMKALRRSAKLLAFWIRIEYVDAVHCFHSEIFSERATASKILDGKEGWIDQMNSFRLFARERTGSTFTAKVARQCAIAALRLKVMPSCARRANLFAGRSLDAVVPPSVQSVFQRLARHTSSSLLSESICACISFARRRS